MRLLVEGQIASKKNGKALDKGNFAFLEDKSGNVHDEENLDKSPDFNTIFKNAGICVPTKKGT